MKIVILGEPRSKKNSQRIIRIGQHPRIAPSKAYVAYERDAVEPIPTNVRTGLRMPLNVQCTFYMKTRRRVDLVNLEEAILDILVKAGVIADDNRDVVAAMDGSRVFYDKANPRTEIEITELTEPYERFGKEPSSPDGT